MSSHETELTNIEEIPIVDLQRKIGRPLKPIWKFFDVIPGDSRRAKCKFCNTVLKGMPTRYMIPHGRKCVRLLESIEHNISLLTGHYPSNERTDSCFESNIFDESIATSLIAEFVVGTGIPFSVLDHSAFKKMIQYFRIDSQAFKSPSRFTFTNTLLPQLGADYTTATKKKLEEEKVFNLALDGWTTRNNENLYAVTIVFADGSTFLYKIIEMNSDSATASFLTTKVEDIIRELTPRRILSIVTDSAPNCKLMRRTIQRKYPNILDLDCFTHTLNLVVKDLFNIPRLGELLKCCTDILAHFNKSSKLSSALEKANKTVGNEKSKKLAQICNTRFATTYLCIASIYNNKSGLQYLAIRTDVLNEGIKNKISDSDFWSKLNCLIDVLEPIHGVLKLSEAANFSLASCFFESLKLVDKVYSAYTRSETILGHGMFSEIMLILSKRLYPLKDDSIYALAASLDPAINSELPWTTEGREKLICRLRGYIVDARRDERGVNSTLELYRSYIGKDQSINIDYEQFWKAKSLEHGGKLLAVVSLYLKAVICNSMSCERMFSLMGWLNAPRRSCLTVDNLTGASRAYLYVKQKCDGGVNELRGQSANCDEDYIVVDDYVNYNNCWENFEHIKKILDVSSPLFLNSVKKRTCESNMILLSQVERDDFFDFSVI